MKHLPITDEDHDKVLLEHKRRLFLQRYIVTNRNAYVAPTSMLRLLDTGQLDKFLQLNAGQTDDFKLTVAMMETLTHPPISKPSVSRQEKLTPLALTIAGLFIALQSAGAVCDNALQAQKKMKLLDTQNHEYVEIRTHSIERSFAELDPVHGQEARRVAEEEIRVATQQLEIMKESVTDEAYKQSCMQEVVKLLGLFGGITGALWLTKELKRQRIGALKEEYKDAVAIQGDIDRFVEFGESVKHYENGFRRALNIKPLKMINSEMANGRAA